MDWFPKVSHLFGPSRDKRVVRPGTPCQIKECRAAPPAAQGTMELASFNPPIPVLKPALADYDSEERDYLIRTMVFEASGEPEEEPERTSRRTPRGSNLDPIEFHCPEWLCGHASPGLCRWRAT